MALSEKVEIIKALEINGYVVYEVKPTALVDFGLNTKFYCVDYANLAIQWNIPKQLLDMVTQYDLAAKEAFYTTYQKQLLFDVKALPRLIKSVNAASNEFNGAKEMAIVTAIIQDMKGVKL